MPDFKTLIASSVDEVGAQAWDALSASRPFQNARWYRFGESVMENCQPCYVILKQGELPIARATFWRIRNEPLSVPPFIRSILAPIFRHWPLFICRSPLSNSSGLILPEGEQQNDALTIIAEAASGELRKSRGSFIIFDYLDADQTECPGWPSGFKQLQVADPGTKLALQGDSFSGYLEASHKFRIHQHYKRSSREAANLGISVSRQDVCNDPASALELIRNVERRHQSAPNPWARQMLEKMTMVEHTWLAAHIGNQLVGCLLLLEDQGVQIALLPGLTEDVPFAYFMLLYEAIQEAFSKKISLLRWGSGAYETKRRLGFELEHNNNAAFQGNGPIPRLIARLAVS